MGNFGGAIEAVAEFFGGKINVDGVVAGAKFVGEEESGRVFVFGEWKKDIVDRKSGFGVQEFFII